MNPILPESSDEQAILMPEGCMPGNVAPFVMRYGTQFLLAMQRAAETRVTPEPSEA
jgi:hypothetical protein